MIAHHSTYLHRLTNHFRFLFSISTSSVCIMHFKPGNLENMDKFSLKWNDFHSNVSKSFQSLRNKEDFCDVTLVGDDFKQIAAHRIILSSCSTYFNNILKNIANNKHPTLCLEGMSFEDIEKVMDYIYNGELKIYQNDIDRFLVVGQRLGLEGLIGMVYTPCYWVDKKKTSDENDAPQNIKHLDESFDIEVQSNKNYKISKTSIYDTNLINTTNNQTIVSFAQESSINSIENLNKKVEESFSRDNDGTFSCHYCQKVFKQRSHVREHVEFHFEGLSLNCNYCEKTLKSRNSLRRHVSHNHGK